MVLLKSVRLRREIKLILIVLGFAGLCYSIKYLNSNIQTSGTKDKDFWKYSPLWVEDQRPHVNPHRFKYILNQPNFCSHSPDLDLLILVTSSPGHRSRRDAIRATWGSKTFLEPFKVKVLFLLGQGKEGQPELSVENQDHHDLIQEDFQDSYRNLTLKTIMGLKWSAIFCPQAKNVMKTDDDIFVNIPLLHQEIDTNEITKISGCIKNGVENSPQPIPDPNNGLLLTPDQLPPAHPAFTAGAGYIIPGDLVQELYVASLSTRLFPVEDVFTTAHCARRIGAHPPKHDRRFSCGEMVLRDCHMTIKFTGHKITEERQFALFNIIQNSETCRNKNNWKVLEQEMY